jgi:hypothetical protein
MSLFTQTRHKGPGRFLQAKIYLFAVGAVLMLVGMAREIDLLIAAAIAVLAVAFVLRFFEKDDEPDEYAEADQDDEETASGELPPPGREIRFTTEREAIDQPRRPVD